MAFRIEVLPVRADSDASMGASLLARRAASAWEEGRMILTLPYPPSNNRYYRHFGGRAVLSEEARAYRWAVLEKRPADGWPLVGPLRMEIHVFPNRGVGQDLDNIPKAVCDALQYANVYANDSQISDLRIVRKPKAPTAKIIVTVEPMGAT